MSLPGADASQASGWWHEVEVGATPVTPGQPGPRGLRRFVVEPFWPGPLGQGSSYVLDVSEVVASGDPIAWLCGSIWPLDALGNTVSGQTPLITFAVHQGRALRLVPTHVAKPWGQEIWYTGVETRGVSCTALPTQPGHEAQVLVPLPYVELALGSACRQKRSSVVLLKELDPFDVPFYGELYTEVHTEKAEVYVVTSLGPRCAPGGVGHVKLGLAAPVLKAIAEDTSLMDSVFEGLAKTLIHYEDVRAQIDGHLLAAGYRFDEQVRMGEAGLAELIRAKQGCVPRDLVRAEDEAWRQATGLFAMHALSVGDVVRVPTGTPHALQPGVRVVEFQTPHYERLILASNQKVMTQSHWDVSKGVATMAAKGTAVEPAQAIEKQWPASTGTPVPIVDFPGLQVVRLELAINPGSAAPDRLPEVATLNLGAPSSALQNGVGPAACYVISGRVHLQAGGQSSWLEPGQGYLLPRTRVELSCTGAGPALLVMGSAESLACG